MINPCNVTDGVITLKEMYGVFLPSELFSCTNMNHKGLKRTANKYAEERRIYEGLISKNEK